jgi:hypothetical protein
LTSWDESRTPAVSDESSSTHDGRPGASDGLPETPLLPAVAITRGHVSRAALNPLDEAGIEPAPDDLSEIDWLRQQLEAIRG